MTCGNTDARSTPAAAGTSPSRASQRGQRTGKRNMGDARAADGRTARALLLADLAQVRPVAELGTRERRRVERDGAARRREVELGTRGRGLRLRLVALAHQLTAAAIAGDLEGETVLRIHRALSAAEARDEARCARLAARLREVELRAWRRRRDRRRDLLRDLRLGLGLGFSFTVVVIVVVVVVVVAVGLEEVAAAVVVAHRAVERARAKVVSDAAAEQSALAREVKVRARRRRDLLREQLPAALVLAHRAVERVRSEVVPHASALQPALAGERELRLGRGRGELRGVRDRGGDGERAEREGVHVHGGHLRFLLTRRV